ncbi:zinc transporter 6, chloroplastic [Magnolia sinica]|uniref:zinc transporter 6, chloroplastic n=1 Tax=Magnolia sinica TaxID=86752 RepID=UPI002659A040|nr:zinc transporter 6, chloroplastic [Magnolia sinica]
MEITACMVSGDGLPKIALYIKGQSSIRKSTMVVTWLEPSPSVINNMILPSNVTLPLAKPSRGVCTSHNLNLLISILSKATTYRMSTELPVGQGLLGVLAKQEEEPPSLKSSHHVREGYLVRIVLNLDSFGVEPDDGTNVQGRTGRLPPPLLPIGFHTLDNSSFVTSSILCFLGETKKQSLSFTEIPKKEREALAMASCTLDLTRAGSCRDGRAASHLKLIAIAVIFITSVIGISTPIVLARIFQGKPTYNKIVLLIKCFAAGVILSTSLVHVLPDAFEALSDCQVASHHPWKDFPFSGFIAMIGALVALLVDIAASSHAAGDSHYTPIGSDDSSSSEAKKAEALGSTVVIDCHDPQRADELAKLKQRLVSQVLEIGIIFHSVIIGVTLGMSQNKCTIRPLVAALAFHQIFEGMGLGGCIAQAGFSFAGTMYMCLMFSVTTPMGIILGMMVFQLTGYDDSSPNALIMEGLLGSFSSGILIYMALVDLIAVDFFHNKLMGSNQWMKKGSYVALVLGSASMSVLALWA